MTKLTSPWELMDPRTKNDSDKTQDIRIPYVGNTFDRVNSTSSHAKTLCSRAKFDLLTPVPRPNEFLLN